jgi:glycosyltransferase involved in cell wall biosynthesis
MAAGVAARRPGTRTTVIPNAADLELFDVAPDAVRRFRAEHRWLGDRPLIVYTGALGAVNGVDYLVRAARRMRDLDPDVQFLVVGHGKEWDDTARLATEYGLLDDTFHMWEQVPKAELPVILGASTLSTSLVRPIRALWDNSANKFFDALAAGRPIAINYGGWQADALREYGAGLVLDPSDADAAAITMARHVRDELWLKEAREAAYRLAVEQFSRDLLFERFEAVLNRSAATRAALSEPS